MFFRRFLGKCLRNLSSAVIFPDTWRPAKVEKKQLHSVFPTCTAPNSLIKDARKCNAGKPFSAWGARRAQIFQRSALVGMVLILISIPLLTSCSTSFTAVKPLGGELYSHPSGIVTLPYPKGWAVENSADSDTVWIHPEDSGSPLRMVLIAEVLPGETEQALLQTAQTRLESYLREILPNDDYEIYNTAEIRVERNPALLLDIARPVQEGYQVGRIVLVYLPGHLVFLAGLGEREAWEVFLPTFRAIVEGMRFSIQPFPFDDE